MIILRIATRKSRLALWQSEHVAGELRRDHPGLDVELVPLSTRGDEELDRSLAEIGGKGLFLKELERAILDGDADFAVHSLKDVPAESPEGLVLAAFLPRAHWGDWWLTRDGRAPDDLGKGERVGTSSLRRQSQLLARYPGLEIVPIRGNVHTRLEKLASGEVEAVILAAAGLSRLEIKPRFVLPLEPPWFLPAPGQGVIVVQCRSDDKKTRALLATLNCEETATAVRAERAVVAELGADCRMPLAALARLQGGKVSLIARLASADGAEVAEATVEGPADQAAELGRKAAKMVLDRGGMRILSHF